MALPMTELTEVAVPTGVEVPVLPGMAGDDDESPPIGPSVAPGRPTTGVEVGRLTTGVDDDLSEEDDGDLRVVLEEVLAVLVGRTPIPPAALLVVFPASG